MKNLETQEEVMTTQTQTVQSMDDVYRLVRGGRITSSDELIGYLNQIRYYKMDLFNLMYMCEHARNQQTLDQFLQMEQGYSDIEYVEDVDIIKLFIDFDFAQTTEMLNYLIKELEPENLSFLYLKSKFVRENCEITELTIIEEEDEE